jgi:DNA-directed RNA polymerase subunit omega
MISAGVDSKDLAKRGESLIRQSTNRYLTTVKIAFRAKQRRFDDFDGLPRGIQREACPSRHRRALR